MEIIKVKNYNGGYLVNDLSFIPQDNGNSDYKQILQWISDGGAVESEFTFNELKLNKKNQLKLNRDSANLRPMLSIQGDEIIFSDDEYTRTSTKKYFAFLVMETGQPATSPSTIIFATLLAASANPSYYLRYSCTIIEGESTRKGYVAIDATTAFAILSHMANRATANISHANELEALINAANSVEELEEINIEF